MIRIIYGGNEVPVGAIELGEGIYVIERQDGVHVLTSTPSAYGGQTPTDPATALPRLTDGDALLTPGEGRAVRIVAVPAASTDLGPGFHRWRDLTGWKLIRLEGQVVTPASAGARLALMFSTDDGSTWNYCDGVGGPMLALDVAGVIPGTYVALASGALARVRLGLFAEGGDGATGVRFASLRYELNAYAPAAGLAPPDFDKADLDWWFEPTFGVTDDGAGNALAVANRGDRGGEWTGSSFAGSVPLEAGGLMGAPVFRFAGGQSFVWPVNSYVGRTKGHVFMLLKMDSNDTAISASGLWVIGGQGQDGYKAGPNAALSYGSTVYHFVPISGIDHWHIFEIEADAGSWIFRMNGVPLLEDVSNTVQFAVTPRIGMASLGLGITGNFRLRGFLDYRALKAPLQAQGVRAYLSALGGGIG